MRHDMTMMRADQLDVSRAMLLVIDIQEKLLPLILEKERVISAACKLIGGIKVLGMPSIVTEQYPRGIGVTIPQVRNVLAGTNFQSLEKPTFSAWAEPKIRDAILALDRPQVIIAGIEAHVCVQQTALDLASRDYDVFVCADAVGSRGRMDYECSLHRMRQNDVIVTTVEGVLFELCQSSASPRFKTLLEIIKTSPPMTD
jgi:isochorismate hydrolase